MKEHSLNEGINRLRKLGITGELKGWYFDKVLSEADIENFDFYRCTDDYFSIKINPMIITGTTHVRYNYNNTWIEMLGGLKHNIYYGGDRMAAIVHDHSLGGKDIRKYGDQYLIEDGNNRLSIGKFMELDHIQVDMAEYRFDHALFNTYSKLKALGLPCKFKRVKDFIIWNITIVDQVYTFNSSEFIEKFIEYYKSVSLTKNDMKYLWNGHHIDKNEQYPDIRTNDDFQKLRRHILAFKHHLPFP